MKKPGSIEVWSLLIFRVFVFRQKNIPGRVTVPVDGNIKSAENIRNLGSAFLLLRWEIREAGRTYIAFEGFGAFFAKV